MELFAGVAQVCFLILCFLIVGLILLQEGKGGGIAALGGAGAENVFGTKNPLRKITVIFVVMFFVLIWGLNMYARWENKSVYDIKNLPSVETGETQEKN